MSNRKRTKAETQESHTVTPTDNIKKKKIPHIVVEKDPHKLPSLFYLAILRMKTELYEDEYKQTEDMQLKNHLIDYK